MATASDATGTLKGVMGNLTSAVRNVGLAMTVASGIVGGAMVGMAMNAQQVSSAFREVDTISREVTDAQEEYGALVSDLNTQFGLQANRMEVIDGLYQSVSAGVTEGAEAQREFLETAAQLAVVGRVDLATTVDVLSTVMNTYGMETEQAQDVSESLFQTVQFGKVRMEELAPVLGRVAALGSELDTQIDEIGASMAVLTRTGFDARVAATGLRNIFRAMMRPSETMQQMLRDIALENDLFADSMEDGAGKVREIANEYQNATEALTKWENKQAEARATSEKSSLALQEARLKIEAIEEGRLDQLPDLTNAQVEEAESVSELEGIIDDYQFKVNKARIEEENARQETEEWQGELDGLRQEFKNDIDAAGDLEGGIGNLVLGNQDFIETLVDLRKKSEEQNIAFNELFPRTRALQGALALVGEDGQALTDVFEEMESGTLDAEEAWSEMDDSTKENFESFDAFKESTEDVQSGDLQEWFDEATGEQATMRDSIARLREVVQDLGAVFSEDVTNSLQNFADSMTKISNFAKGMEESMRSNISQFFILATTLGLVIGPLLLIGGQFALIAQALGPALIPFLTISAGLFGLLAAAIKTTIEGGSGASEMLSGMSNALSTITGYLKDAYLAFKVLILPELIVFGKTLFGLFSSIAGGLSQFTSETGGLTGDIFNLADAIGETVMALNKWFVQNEELIIESVTKLAGILIKEIIPNLIDFASGILQVIANIDPAPFLKIAGVLGFLAVKMFDVLGIIGRWLQRNDELIGSLITWGVIIGSAAVGIFKLVSGIGILAGLLSGLGGGILTVVAGFIGLILKTGSLITAIKIIATAVVPNFVAGLSALGTVLGLVTSAVKLLIIPVAALAGVLGLPVWVTGLLIAALVGLIAIGWKFRDEIWKALVDAKKAFVQLYSDSKKWLSSLGSAALTWGENLIDAFILGIQNKYSQLVSALKGVSETVKGWLGFGSAPPERGEEYNPDNWGGNVSSSFSKGMLNEEGKIKDSAMGISDSAKEGMSIDMSSEEMFNFNGKSTGEEVESKVGVGKAVRQSGGSLAKSQMPGGSEDKDVTVEEGAITVGPFHGISDEELPEKVNKEVERSLEQIIEEMRGSGRDSIERY